MKSKWYARYEETFRTGSFTKFAKNSRGHKGPSRRTTGANARITWNTLPKPTARFLHWLGFEPNSSLPPPSKEVADALSFLAHDTVGRIVESAITSLLEAQPGVQPGDAKFMDLPKGFQLRPEHVVDACRSGHIFACELRGAEEWEKRDTNVQKTLYWGPGCEERIEAELKLLDKSMTGEKTKDPLESKIPAREGPRSVKNNNPEEEDAEKQSRLKDEEIFSNLDTSMNRIKPHSSEDLFYVQVPITGFSSKEGDKSFKPATNFANKYVGFHTKMVKAFVTLDTYEDLFKTKHKKAGGGERAKRASLLEDEHFSR
tara:strand:+ start:758 stop:1702 length:945 start_codon:yes stop_codon:yes gene_type:complete